MKYLFTILAFLTCFMGAKAQSDTKPIVWQEWLTNDGNPIIPNVATGSQYVGDAEFGSWPDWALALTDGVNINWRGNRTGEICAWALTKGRNNDNGVYNGYPLDGEARPYPADIEEEPGNPSNHVFAVHASEVKPLTDDKYAYSNQFYIQSPKGWKAGTNVRIKFRYKADVACSVATMIYGQHPTDYRHYEAVGNVNFITKWQDFEQDLVFSSSQAGGWSLGFNLNSDATNGQVPNVFYFDDLSWQTIVLDEGLFVAASNSKSGLEYDFDNAIEFQAKDGLMVATVGTIGDQDTWVDEIMISTVRGIDASFKGATLKLSGYAVNDPNKWITYTEGSNAKIKLPGAGVWTISINTEKKQMNFVKVEGVNELVINPNPTVIIVKGQERDYLSADDYGNPREAGIGTGQYWDNQFYLVANRTLSAGEITVLKFKYKASRNAKTTTMCYTDPGVYKHWSAIGDVNFTTGLQDFEMIFTVPNKASGMQTIAFNMAEIKEACNYEIRDVVWKLWDGSESLINQIGVDNFWVKEGSGDQPHVYVPQSIYGRKCEKPTITIVDGKLHFESATEGATYIYYFTTTGAPYEGNDASPATIKVTAFARKAEYDDSDPATAEFTVTVGLRGDLNNDGTVNVADHVELSDIIMKQDN